MLDVKFESKAQKIFDFHQEIVDSLFDINGKEISENIVTDIISILKSCEEALHKARSARDYNQLIHISGLWTFFLDSRGIRYNFKKPPNIPDAFPEISNAPQFNGVALDDISKLHDLSLVLSGRRIKGIATRDTIDKTVPVEVVQRIMHERTGKIINSTKKFLVHDEFNIAARGDEILAAECRPISKRKSFILLSIKSKNFE